LGEGGEGRKRERESPLTISKRTSPGANDSPSFTFQFAIPPSVIVGDLRSSRKRNKKMSLRGRESSRRERVEGRTWLGNGTL